MIIICGNSIAEVEQDLAMAKMAMASGAPVGLGGASVEDEEKALSMLKNMGLPTPNPDLADYEPDADEYEEEEDSIAEQMLNLLERVGAPDYMLEYIRENY